MNKSLWVIAVVFFLQACGGGGNGGSNSTLVGPAIDDCSVQEQNTFVFDLMNDIYFWINDVPEKINSDFASPEDVLEAFRFEPLDRFSDIRDRAENNALFTDSQFIGFGISLIVVDDDRVRLTQVFSDGPAAAAGLQRGDELIAINGRSVKEILDADGSVGDAFGDDEEGVTGTIDYIDSAGNELQVQLSKRFVTIETVPLVSEFDVAGRKTGYLFLRNFVEPSFAALDNAFSYLTAARVDDLILDLRYNGGGLIEVAEYLGDLIGGTVTDDEIFSKRVHNANNIGRNTTTRFRNRSNALSLEKVVVINGTATASASELVVNALNPFVQVTLVGGTTFGKPVGSYQFEFCDKVALPIAFSNFNAIDQGDYFDGFTPDCPADDDLDRALGDEMEVSLAEALKVVETGTCSSAVTSAFANKQKRSRDINRKQLESRSEFRQLINAY